MGKLNYKTSEFDAAIRKVRSDYADVTGVDVTASDIIEGKTAMTPNKELIKGTIGNAEIKPVLEIESQVISSEVSDYKIAGYANATVNTQGIFDEDVEGAITTKYIKTEEKSGTPSYDENVVIEHSNGRLMDKVTIEKTPDFVSKVSGVPICNFKIGPITVGTSYGGRISAGTTENNVYARTSTKNPLEKIKLYLIPMPSGFPTSQAIVSIPTSEGKLPEGTIIMHAGDSFTSEATTYTPGGVFSFTSEGRVTFYHTSAFSVCSGWGSSSCPIVFLNNGIYYIPCVDYSCFSHSHTGYGTRITSGGIVSSVTDLRMNSLVGYIDYSKPGDAIGNITNIYWYGVIYPATETRYNTEYPRMTFNYGSGYGAIFESEE